MEKGERTGGTRAGRTGQAAGKGSDRESSGSAGGDAAQWTVLLAALRALESGDFGCRLPESNGVPAEVAAAFNGIAAKNQRLVGELGRLRDQVGQGGHLGERLPADVGGGGWAACVEAANGLVEDLTGPVAEMGAVLTAVADGDLTQKMALQDRSPRLRGDFARIGSTVNRLVDQLSLVASEVTRVAREVGTDGVLGGQARVPKAAGTWRDLTDSFNVMASNLTSQVRDISSVATAVASGDLNQQITVNARGEVAELADTLNSMTATLRTFSGEVT
ncbi:MAG: HAMP domain-containing protein, partial [Mycobacteriales bacterium]